MVDFGKLWFLQKRHTERYISSTPFTNPSHNLDNLAVKPILQLLSYGAIDRPGRFDFYHSMPSISHEEYVREILWADAKQYTTPTDFIKRHAHFWAAPTSGSLAEKMPALRLHNVPSITSQPSPAALTPFFSNFSEIAEEDWNTAEIKSWIDTVIEQATARSFVKVADRNKHWSEKESGTARTQWSKAWNKLVYQYLRWALMGSMHGPSAAETMRILGRNETLRRFDVARELVLRRADGKGLT